MKLTSLQRFNLKKIGKYILMGAAALGAIAIHHDICFTDGQMDGADKMRTIATNVYPDFHEKVSEYLDEEDAEESDE